MPTDPILDALVAIGRAVDAGCIARAAQLAVEAGLFETGGRLLMSLVLEAERA